MARLKHKKWLRILDSTETPSLSSIILKNLQTYLTGSSEMFSGNSAFTFEKDGKGKTKRGALNGIEQPKINHENLNPQRLSTKLRQLAPH